MIMDIWEDHYKEIETAFPELTFQRLQGGGVNVYLPDRVLTFWFKKHNYGDNRTGKWLKLPGLQTVKEIKEIISNKLLPAPEKKTNKAIFYDDKGTQACIDHILKKLAKYKELNPGKGSKELELMLLNLAGELKQYL